MCMRMCPLTYEEARDVLAEREASGRARASASGETAGLDPMYDAYPGSVVPAFVPDEAGKLNTVRLTWGFPLEGRRDAVYNTRLETALEQVRRGRRGMWASAILYGRCLVPVRAFYERHGSETVTSPKTGKPVGRQYRFRMPGASAFLLAGVTRDGYLSVVTTVPNADVAPVHDRMPLVLGAGESSVWLGPSFAGLAACARPHLESKGEAGR